MPADDRSRTLAATILEAFVEQDASLCITDWNSQAEALWGWPAQAAIGMRSHLLIPERNRGKHDRALRDLFAARQQRPVSREITALHRDGREFRIEVSLAVAPHRGEDRLVAFARDLSEIHAARARAYETEQLYRLILDQLDDGYFEMDLGGTFTYVNEAYCRMVGLPAADLLGANFRKFVSDPEQIQTGREAYRRVYETGQPLRRFEYAFIHRDGRRRIHEDSVSLKRNAAGAPVGFMGTRRDVTEQRNVAERLRQSEERYRAILERIEDGYFEIDLSRKGRYEFVNDAFCRITGYARDELLGHSYEEFFDADTIQFLYNAYRNVYLTGESAKGLEYAILAKDGTRKFVEESVSLRRDSSGAAVGFMGVRRDSTVRKTAEEELARAKEAAESASRAKSEFLANMSHEIRTPMNGIIGMTELVLETDLTPYQAECLLTVKSSAASLMTVINDVLDFSKIESRKLELESAPFSLTDVIADTIKPLALQAHQKRLELIADLPPDLPVLLGDAVRLRQVLTNLLANAVKFTERGHVMLAVAASPVLASNDPPGDPSGRLDVRFEVSDTGIGIAPDKHAAIFEAFSQADGSTTRRFGGTGLGLTISSTLVGLMGGRLHVDSVPGRGSTFFFSLPFTLANADVPAIRSQRLGGLRVLIVDDNAVNRRIFEAQALRWGMQARSVDGGHAALDALAAAARDGRPFDLVLLDAHMPDVDGFKVAERLRGRSDLSGATVMMLTSGGHYGDAQRCRDLGIRAYLNKPVKAAELFDAICRALDGAPSAAPAPAPAGSVALAAAPLAILLAEDNVVNQRVAVGLLSRRGHRVVVAGTGREAIEKFDREPFDVVLMDVQMPEMGGFEATAEIRRREAGSGRRTRIVAMTAHAMAGDRERCMAAGMDGYVAKPIVPAALFEGIERADEQHPLEPAAFDHDELLSRLGGDEELLADVVKMFLEDCPKRLAAIRRAIDAADAPLVRAEAHALKGAAGNLSAGALSAAARAIESAAAAGHLDGAARGWRQLSADAERLMDALRRANFCEA